MANNTIYPYGVSASAPTGLNIVNDLTNSFYAEQSLAVKEAVWATDATSWFGTDFGKALTLLHFSDIHGDSVNLARIVAFKGANSALDAALFTGDMVHNDWSDGIDFWAAVGAQDILVAIGNHDSRSGKTATDCYGRYISPFVSNWGVTSQANLCYYYKDWSAKNVRLIVLDCMHWDGTQASWLASTLAAAKTAGYHVVVANHYAPASSPTGIKSCSFDTLGSNDAQWDNINSAAPSAVQDFIDGGGKFVCWLCGHTHADMFRHPASYPHQLYVAVANAGMNAHTVTASGCQLYREDGGQSQDLFNLVSVNPVRNTLTIVRVGADRDTIGRHIGTVVYDYAENEIIWND